MVQNHGKARGFTSSPGDLMETGNYTLYQWPSSEYTDSIYVRCTKIQRALGYLKIPYKVAEISLPYGANEKELSGKINPLMRKIPILKDEQNYVEETENIVDHLVEVAGLDGFRTSVDGVPGPGFFVNHWIERWLVWLVIYGRWRREENFNRFMKTVGKPDQRILLKAGMIYTRKRACEILSNTEVGALSESAYMDQLREGFRKIDSILSHSPYLTGKWLTETDLGLFMCVQVFLDPSLRDESGLILEFDSLCRWAKQVDEETSTCHTKPLRLLYAPDLREGKDEEIQQEDVKANHALVPRIKASVRAG